MSRGHNRVVVAGEPMDCPWPDIFNSRLARLSPESQERAQLDRIGLINTSVAQLNEINLGCRNKPQYAKTYGALRRDKREMVEKMRAKCKTVEAELQELQTKGE